MSMNCFERVAYFPCGMTGMMTCLRIDQAFWYAGVIFRLRSTVTFWVVSLAIRYEPVILKGWLNWPRNFF